MLRCFFSGRTGIFADRYTEPQPINAQDSAQKSITKKLECVARDVTSQSGTLGQIVQSLALPRPLDTAIEKLWGFASNRARHVQEGEAIMGDEAELAVSVACAVSRKAFSALSEVRTRGRREIG